MAANKKSTTKTRSTTSAKPVAKKKPTVKKTTNTTTSGRNSNNFPRAYMRLRTVLDALEIISLRYCLELENESDRIWRAEEIEGNLIPIIQRYEKNLSAAGSGGCPDGFYFCDGCCVPYRCPDIRGASDTSAKIAEPRRK